MTSRSAGPPTPTACICSPGASCRCAGARRAFSTASTSPTTSTTPIARLLEIGALERRPRGRAPTSRRALKIKGRGRLRIQRELAGAWASPTTSPRQALAEAFGDVDERSLITEGAREEAARRSEDVASRPDYARMFQFLVRQGFSPATVTAVLRAIARARADE